MSAWKWVVSLSAFGVALEILTLACVTPGTIIPGGDPVAGQTTFEQLCSSCHSAASLAFTSGRIVNDLGTISPRMAGITLTNDQIANMQAFIATQ